MALLVVDFNFLDGRDGESVVKELAIADSQSNRISSYLFKSPYTWGEVPTFNVRFNNTLDHGCNWNDGYILYSELENILHREASSAVEIYCFGAKKSAFISGLIDRTVIDITQLQCPQHTELAFKTVSCTFSCHKRATNYCAMRSAYALARWLQFRILALQCEECPSQPHIH